MVETNERAVLEAKLKEQDGIIDDLINEVLIKKPEVAMEIINELELEIKEKVLTNEEPEL